MIAFEAMSDLIVLPVLLPMATAALILLAGEKRRQLNAALALVSTASGLTLAIALLAWVHAEDAPGSFGVYLPGNWPVPFGIVLVVDRLSALMLVLTSACGLAALLFALPRWLRAGVHFHPLFQLQLMGLQGAFLTADLFNLFVFFEVLLAASYGLLLHGGGSQRVRAGLHYIAINLVASMLFLIGIALLYGVTGTLNMADMARKLPLVPPGDRGLLHAGAALLATAFLAKAGQWPLNFWLPQAYGSAGAPVAALFAVLTKVGVYAVLRLWTLCFPASAGDSALFGAEILIWTGMCTLVFGSIGMMATQEPNRLASYSIVVSAGTLMAAIGFDREALSAGALFYLASSTLAACTLFLMVELLERRRDVEFAPPQSQPQGETLPDFVDAAAAEPANLDDDEQALIGRALPAAVAFLGVGFTLCAMVVAGLPPLSGFVGKVAMLAALLDAARPAAWTLFALMIFSGLLVGTSLLRVGARHFWLPQERASPRLRIVEGAPVALLLAALAALAIQGESVLHFMRLTAQGLHAPDQYIEAVLSARPVSLRGEGGSR